MGGPVRGRPAPAARPGGACSAQLCWPAIVLVGVATRMVLDPGTNIYYSGGLVAGAALWDIAGSRRDFPWWTAAATVTLYAARRLPLPPSSNGWFLLAFFAAVVALIVVRRPSLPEGSRS